MRGSTFPPQAPELQPQALFKTMVYRALERKQEDEGAAELQILGSKPMSKKQKIA